MIIVATLLLLAAAAAAAAEPPLRVPADQDEGLVRMAFSSSIFDIANREDVVIALQMWANELAGFFDARYRGETVIYDSAAAAVVDVLAGRIDFVVLSSVDFLIYQPQMHLTPAMVPVQTNGRVTERYLLLVQAASSLTSWQTMAGADLAIVSSAANPLPRMWLEVELARQGLGPARDYFHLHEVRDAPKAALPVFFSQLDACIVSDRSLATLAEMNPQVGQDLRIVTNSADLLEGVTSFGPGCSASLRALTLRTIGDLHERPQGRMILDLFGRSSIVPFREEYLQGVRELVAAYKTLVPRPESASSP